MRIRHRKIIGLKGDVVSAMSGVIPKTSGLFKDLGMSKKCEKALGDIVFIIYITM